MKTLLLDGKIKTMHRTLNTVFLMLLCLLFLPSDIQAQISDIEKNNPHLVAFAKAYGYVKYFHPSDEAYDVNWNAFSVYGAQQMLACKSDKDAAETLNRLFKPIAPSAHFALTTSNLDTSTHVPENPKSYKTTYWQHRGLGYEVSYTTSAYKSVRVNRPYVKEKGWGSGNIVNSVPAEEYRGKAFRYSAFLKLEKGSSGFGKIWARSNNGDSGFTLFDDMSPKVISGDAFQRYEVQGEIASNAKDLSFGVYLSGGGILKVDSVLLEVKTNGIWESVPFTNQNFEVEKVSDSKKKTAWVGKGNGYDFDLIKDAVQGQYSLSIGNKRKVVKAKPLFKTKPDLEKVPVYSLSINIHCAIPLVLYVDKNGTFPKANSTSIHQLNNELARSSKSPEDLSLRLGNVINTYNVFQHFYPYFDVVEVDWEQALKEALTRSFSDKNESDHIITLRKFTAKLQDAHVFINGSKEEYYSPPFSWSWIENKLVITSIKGKGLTVKPGDIVSHINGKLADNYLDEFRSRAAAGNEGRINFLACNGALIGPKNSNISVLINGEAYTFQRTFNLQGAKPAAEKPKYRVYNDSIVYMNLDKISMAEIKEHMKEVKRSKAIICDLRGYPNSNHQIISHFMRKRDTCKSWMQVPNTMYPNQEQITEWEKYGWQMLRRRPYLGDKNVIFITGPTAISYAESVLGLVKGYNLATIVGQPSAGANGNINPFRITGGYSISWTGMKVTRLNGEQHHTVGVLPDVYVNQTVAGIKAGKDEYLEKALELVK